MQLEDALLYIIQWVREGSRSEYSNYGYDIYIPNVIRAYLAATNARDRREGSDQQIRELSPFFLSAAWELCRRGIIRPGVRVLGLQSTDEGNAGSGYSVTPFGRQWLQEEHKETFIPTEPQRFAQMLQPFQTRFGLAFYDRAQEAVRCYGAHAYLACCTMCGAAAESILLVTAIAKSGDEINVFDKYRTSGGRSRIENLIIGQATSALKNEFQGLTSLIKYWRDEAAHGAPSNISDNEAYTSLAMLLRYADFVYRNWDKLMTAT